MGIVLDSADTLSSLQLTATEDYTAASGIVVTFGPTDTVKTVTVSTTEDDVYELLESFQGQLTTTDSGVSLGVSEATANINDDDSKLLNYHVSLSVSRD